jgi:hypothetical protein
MGQGNERISGLREVKKDRISCLRKVGNCWVVLWQRPVEGCFNSNFRVTGAQAGRCAHGGWADKGNSDFMKEFWQRHEKGSEQRMNMLDSGLTTFHLSGAALCTAGVAIHRHVRLAIVEIRGTTALKSIKYGRGKTDAGFILKPLRLEYRFRA